jgi:2-dehydro-3-deoxyphosphogluconate aldolase/(4S)-4-hydroxy-2-oxoglutarate aldolase
MDLTEVLRARRVLAIVRGTDPDAALRTVLTLAAGGLTAIEVSLTTTDALGVLARARAELGDDVTLGAGTVLTVADAVRAAEAGATYLVTPALGEDLRSGPVGHLPVLLGALTPTEVVTAMTRGAAAVKLFPSVPFVPVGGVDLSTARTYLDGGALAVGIGSPLVGDAASGGDQAELRQRIDAFRAGLDLT